MTKQTRSFKKLSKKKKIMITGLAGVLFFVTAVLGTYFFIQYRYNTDILEPVAGDKSTPKPTDLPIGEEQAAYEIESNIVNVLLVGVDTRGEFEDSRTDSIIIATIDPGAKTVKMTSLMRDMYVEIPKRGYQRINAAFSLGGIDLLRKTIKHNFGLDVEYYAAIDFKGFQELIDKVGGVEVEVKDYEVKEINKYIKEVNGANSTLLPGEGLLTLNGQQALSYSRIRKVGNGDYERTERQRRVISLLLNKVKDMKITDFPKLYSTITPYLKTNVPFSNMLKLGYTVYKFEDFNPESMRIPIDGYFKSPYINGMSVLVPNLKYSANELFKFIYSIVPDKLVVPDNSRVYNYKPRATAPPDEDVSPKATPKPTVHPTTAPTEKPAATATPKPVNPTATPKVDPPPKVEPTPTPKIDPPPKVEPTPTPKADQPSSAEPANGTN